MHVSLSLTGSRDTVAADLTEGATDSPETEIRQALAAYLTRQAEPDQKVSISFRLDIDGD